MTDTTSPTRRGRLFPAAETLIRLPLWAVAALLLGIFLLWGASADQTYQEIFNTVGLGLGVTVYVCLIAYAASLFFGLVLALMRRSPNPIVYHTATFYVEVMRGLPMLVVLLYVAFVVTPGIVDGINALGRWLRSPLFVQFAGTPLQGLPEAFLNTLALRESVWGQLMLRLGTDLANLPLRNIPNITRVIIALVMAYAAFLSEVFRAGIESVERGQTEAARSLGMTQWQAMRYVVLPQAIRNIMPALGNDFIAMLKDSSLVAWLGVQDITGRGTVYAAASFQYFKTYNVIAFFYLTMTLILSFLVRMLERALKSGQAARSRRSIE
jgi:polar amino acid transport system permease protein